jgi:CubicO group peptidase (beta-lactamase class C family)
MKKLKRFIGYLLIIGSSTAALAMITDHMYIFEGIKQAWLRGDMSGNIDDLKYAIDTRVLAPSDPSPWAEAENINSFELSEETLRYMEGEEIASFLVIKNDTIIFEKYWLGHDEETLSNSFSMAKTIVAMSIGLAVEDGLIDVQAPVSKYLPRFSEGLGEGLTVEHLLQMRSNIPFGESYTNPFGFPAKAYYKADNRALLSPYRPISTPGSIWEYQSGNTMLLSEILSSVQDKTLADYVSEGIWGPVHAEHNAEWGLDAVDGVERSFAQFYSTTRDFARFGKLIQDGGMVDSTQVIAASFIEDMITPVSDDKLEVSAPHYGYQIWLGHTDDGIEFSYLRGHRCQYVISIPSQNLVIVKTGYKRNLELKRFLSSDTYIYIETALQIGNK